MFECRSNPSGSKFSVPVKFHIPPIREYLSKHFTSDRFGSRDCRARRVKIPAGPAPMTPIFVFWLLVEGFSFVEVFLICPIFGPKFVTTEHHAKFPRRKVLTHICHGNNGLRFPKLMKNLKLFLQFNIPCAVDNKPRTAKVGAISKAQILKGGPFGLCETPAGCKKFFKK